MSDLKIDTSVIAPPKLNTQGAGEGSGDLDFTKVLAGAIERANEVQQHAQNEAKELAAGRGDSLEAVLAITKAEMSLKFISQVRNRALEAFNEIMRMPV